MDYEGYSHVLERVLQEPLPGKPWVALDRDNYVRCGSRNITLLGYSPKDVRENPRSLRDYIATDKYESSLCSLMAYIDATLQRNHPFGVLRERRHDFKIEHAKTRQMSVDTQLRRIGDIISKFIADPSPELDRKIRADIRVKRQDGTGVSIDDEMLLVRYRGPGGMMYAGALVTLDTRSQELSPWNKFKSKLPFQSKDPRYDVHEKPMVIDSMFHQDDVKHYVKMLMDVEHHDVPLVLDFKLAKIANPEYVKVVLMTAQGFASKELIVGNASDEVRRAASAQLGKNAKFRRLYYHPRESCEMLNAKIEEGLSQLRQRADKLSRERLSYLQPNPEGKGFDLPSAGESPQQQP